MNMKKVESRQSYRSVMRRKSRTILTLVILGILCLSIIAIIAGRMIKYRPPAHDEKAVSGEPVVSEDYLYREMSTDFGYSFLMAANLYRQEDGALNIYLTNPKTNEVNIRCEIKDRDRGTLYYKSGLILPGEYVTELKPETKFSNEPHNVDVIIYAFEPDTYLSAGTTNLKLVLQAW